MDENNQNIEELDESHLIKIRKEKLEELQQKNKNPFDITKYKTTHKSQEIKENFDKLNQKDVIIAGRIVAKRIMGKASFYHIQDSQDKIQAYISVNDLGEEDYTEIKTFDIGDIIGIEGFVFKTRTEEISIHAKKIVLLAKSLRPLPEKFHGLKDTDLRYRQRYVDLIVNPDVKETFIKRNKILKSIRNFLDEKGYLEVDTPILNIIPGGAAAKPFKTHHNTLDLEMYLRIANELYLKRLIVGGFDKVYEMGRMFRNEGISIKHNPEFTNIELYSAYEDYNDMMDITEELVSTLAKEICGTTKVNYQGTEIDLTPGWKRITIIDSIKEVTGIDFNKIDTDAEAAKAAKGLGLTVDPKKATRGAIIMLIFDEKVEKTLIQPTFVCDYPVEDSLLAKRKPTDNSESSTG